MNHDSGTWAIRLGVAGATIGVIAVIAYFSQGDRYVNPVAGVALYSIIGFGVGSVIDRVIAKSRRR